MYLQPKDIPEVLNPLNEIKESKLFLKYMPYPDVYRVAMAQIELHPEFDVIFWHQNDTIITNELFQQMKKDFIESKLDFLAFNCNVDLTDYGMSHGAYSMREVSTPHYGNIDWVPMGEHKGIIEVQHSGCPFMISRKLLLQCPLKGEPITGINADVIHCLDLKSMGVPVMLHADYRILHLRYRGEMLVGHRTSVIEWQK